jgi:hypothetical protein
MDGRKSRQCFDSIPTVAINAVGMPVRRFPGFCHMVVVRTRETLVNAALWFRG